MAISETTVANRAAAEASRARRLKAATGETHERLDQAIMRHEPFASCALYGRFLAVQHGFHRDIDALYDDAGLAALVPDLTGRRRLALIARDLADLGLVPPVAREEPVFAAGMPADLPTALGWLYVAEGSNLGAAFLLKEAARIGLHWRTFTAALDALALPAEAEPRVTAGAEAAFRRVHGLVKETFA